MNNKIYAGVGSRKTPPHIIQMMEAIGRASAQDGMIISTGAAKGADQAFANGANQVGGKIYLHLPWHKYEENWVIGITPTTLVLQKDDTDAYTSVNQFHPSPNNLTPAVIALHARNYNIVKNAQYMICWTKGGLEVGGTGQAIRLARDHFKIPVWNLGDRLVYDAFNERLIERREL